MSKKRRHTVLDGAELLVGNQLKRQRQYTEEDAKLARIYNDLASELHDARIQAAGELLSRISPPKCPNVEFVNQVLARLVRGLCSGRKAARLGFFIALTEAIRQLYSVSASPPEGFNQDIGVLIDMITSRTQVQGKDSAQEKRDHWLGRMFGYKAIIQSSILTQDSVPLGYWKKIIDLIFSISREKAWLREECGLIICDAILNLSGQATPEKYISYVAQYLDPSNPIRTTPEGVAIWLTIQSHHPKCPLPNGSWHKKDPLSKKERTNLAKILNGTNTYQENAANGDGKKIQSGSGQQMPNFAWDIILKNIIDAENEKYPSIEIAVNSNFSKFWIDMVDDNLFSASASPERKNLGLQLFKSVIATTPAWALSATFTPNLMKCIINQRINPDRYLHAASMVPLKELVKRVRSEPDLAAPILLQLISGHGIITFDRATKTKTVETLLSIASDNALAKIVEHFAQRILRPGTADEAEADSYRNSIADMLMTIIRGRSSETLKFGDSTDVKPWLRELILLLSRHAYFVSNKLNIAENTPIPSLSSTCRTLFKNRLSSCLTSLIDRKIDEQVILPYTILSAIKDWHANDEGLDLDLQADENVSEIIENGHKTLNRIVSKLSPSGTSNIVYLASKLLYSSALLQVYNGDPEAASIVEELEEFYPSFMVENAVGTSSHFSTLLEILLSLLSKYSKLCRIVVEQVFTAFAKHFTSDDLQSLVEILDKKENTAGQNELFAPADEGVDDEDESDNESDLSVKVDSASRASDSSSNDSESDEDDTSDGDNTDVEDLELKAKLATVLNMEPTTSADTQKGESDDEDMNDEQMMALEPYLAKVFQEQKKASSKRVENKEAKETVIAFKNRILDLLAIYVKQEHANPLALELILPLLHLTKTTSSKQVSEKAYSLLRQYFDACRGKELPNPHDVKALWSTLTAIHGEAVDHSPRVHTSACSRSSLFVVKVLTTLDSKNYTMALDIYSNTQKIWYANPQLKLESSFFTEWMSWSVNTRVTRK